MSIMEFTFSHTTIATTAPNGAHLHNRPLYHVVVMILLKLVALRELTYVVAVTPHQLAYFLLPATVSLVFYWLLFSYSFIHCQQYLLDLLVYTQCFKLHCSVFKKIDAMRQRHGVHVFAL